MTKGRQILSRLTAFRYLWKVLLVALLVLLAVRLLPDSVRRVEVHSGEDPSPRRGLLPSTQQFPAPGMVPSVAVGQRFASLAELTEGQAAGGYVRTGYFGGAWPATVTEVLNHNDGISFTRKNGSRHNYTGFDGYRMQVVRLSGSGRSEVVVVFRSAARR